MHLVIGQKPLSLKHTVALSLNGYFSKLLLSPNLYFVHTAEDLKNWFDTKTIQPYSTPYG